MALTNSNISTTGLVEKYIGTAYDKMAEIHAELSNLLLIAGSIEDGSFDEVAQIADELSTVIDKIDGFNSTYYGALDATPVFDPNGDSITEGDLYYDIIKRLMYVFIDSWWVPLGAVNHKVVYRRVDDAMVNPDHVLIDLGHDPAGNPYTYLPGTNNMTVHLNGDLLVGTHVNNVYGQYSEIDQTTIKIWNPDIENPLAGLNDEVVFNIGTEAATVTHIGEVGRYVYTTVVANETVIPLPDGVSYIQGANNITVHLKLDKGDSYDRGLQLVDEDYAESSPTTITFLKTLPTNSQVVITIGHIIANDDEHYAVIMATGKPDEMAYDEGQLWFKTDTGRMFILYFDDVPDEEPAPGDPWTNRQWIGITPEDTVIGPDYVIPSDPPPTVIHGTIFQDTAPVPEDHSEGTLWFNIKTGNLHIKYQDLDSHQWVKVSV